MSLDTQLINIVRHMVCNQDQKNIDLDTPLGAEGLGLDSIGRLNLLSEIENTLCMEFPEEYWGGRMFLNLRGIYNFIMEREVS